MTKLIIEHMESRLWKWCLTEYKHISDSVGRNNLIFTGIKKVADRRKLMNLGKVFGKSIFNLKFKKVCVLDPTAKKTLTGKDKSFDYLLLGGILGDFPPRKRTKKELTEVLGYPARNLGNNQMSTNTAAYVAWRIINGTPLNSMKFKRGLKVKIGKYEEIELPFKFLVENGKIFMPKDYLKLVKSRG